MHLTSDDVAAEDWSSHDKYSPQRVTCESDHTFVAHSKFSGRLVAIVSRTACPVCGTHSLRASRSGPDTQTLTKKDVGDA